MEEAFKKLEHEVWKADEPKEHIEVYDKFTENFLKELEMAKTELAEKLEEQKDVMWKINHNDEDQSRYQEDLHKLNMRIEKISLDIAEKERQQMDN